MKCRESLMEELRAMNFAIVDLKLYLNTHPCECRKVDVYNQFVQKYKALMAEYEENFGPLVADTYESDCPWEWIENPWPWDKKCEKMGG